MYIKTVARLSALLLAFGILIAGRAGAQDEPTGLLCNLLTHPEKCVISEPRPDFGWIVNSRVPNDWQSAFRILVASEPELLAKREGNFWDSGKVVSAQSTNVIYAGKPLASGASYWWCVNTWNKDGKESGFSAPQRFNTGEFNWVKRARGRPWIRSPGGDCLRQISPDASAGKADLPAESAPFCPALSAQPGDACNNA